MQVNAKFLKEVEKYFDYNLDEEETNNFEITRANHEEWNEELVRLMNSKNLKDSDVYVSSNITKKVFMDIKQDSNYPLSKDLLIRLTFGLKLTIKEASYFYSLVNEGLSYNNKRDLVFRFFIEERLYNIKDLGETLYRFNLKALSKAE